jgi:glycosyltransferase involved in cell wall biosynthesis
MKVSLSTMATGGLQKGGKQRVLLVGNFLSASAGSRGVCEDLAERLAAAECSVLTTSRIPGRVRRLLDMVRTIWLQRDNFDVAHIDVYSGSAFFWAEVVSWTLGILGKSYILTLHGGNLPAFARRWPGRVRRLLSTAHVVTTPSLYLQEQMAPYHERLYLLPNPLDLARYRFRLRERPQPHLIWLRAFHSIYNPVLAVEVLARLVEEYPTARLTMVGPDKGDGSFQATQRQAVARKVTHRVRFVGSVAKGEVPEWLSEGDIFINTTNVDNTPVSVLEAMACGLCVVSTDVGGIPYLLQHEQDALLVPPADADAMTAAIHRLIENPSLASHISQQAYLKARQCDWEVILPQWQDLFERVAQNG